MVNKEIDTACQTYIKSFPKETSILEIVAACMNKYGDLGQGLSFSDWGKIVRTYISQSSSEDDKSVKSEGSPYIDSPESFVREPSSESSMSPGLNKPQKFNPIIYTMTSKDITDKIAHDHLGRSSFIIEEDVKSRVPATFMGYLQDNDHDVYLRLMSLLSEGAFTIDGVRRFCKIYKTPDTAIQRFFINKNDWMKLSLPARRRWADTPFRYNGEIYFITNQIDGHDIEGKNNVRINDFAMFIYDGSEHKYFVNFVENGLDRSSAKYIHELRHIV